MFEESLLESQGRLVSTSRRWVAVGSLGLQCLIAAGIVLVPLVRPETLPVRGWAPAVAIPVPRKPPVVMLDKARQAVSHRASAISLPSIEQATHAAVLPAIRPVDALLAMGDPPVASLGAIPGIGGPGGVGDLLGPVGAGGSHVVVAARKPEPARISAGVSAGMLLGEMRPVYPRIALAAKVEGVVVIEATISKAGLIESARVVSGPAMLQGAAIDAVRGARYRPFRLNGEATEVQTTVTVRFRLGNG